MRLLSFVTQLFVFWVPLAVAVLLIGLAFHFNSPGLGIQAGMVLLILGLYKAIEWGVTQSAAKKG
ncbi:hypothetical protein BH10PSE18_BH10PSE18_36740 [soil metagenome]